MKAVVLRSAKLVGAGVVRSATACALLSAGTRELGIADINRKRTRAVPPSP